MSLFTNNRKHRFSRDSHRRVVVIKPTLPGFMKRLDNVLCRQSVAHQLPLKMKCIGESLSDNGRPMAIYACPFCGCTWREGWVVDRYNDRRPHCLWCKFYQR